MQQNNGNGAFSSLPSINDIQYTPSAEVGKWYWIWGLENGRRILWGPYNSSDEAYRIGYERLTHDFDVEALPTRDEAKASRIMKSKLLHNGTTPSDALKRLSHQRPDKPKRRKKNEGGFRVTL